MGLFPRSDRFFDLLELLVRDMYRGAELFAQLFHDFSRNSEYAAQIKEVERECDRHSAAIVEWLNASFITPLDREDIYTLATELDDIMDMITEIARLTVLYGIKETTPAAQELANLLRDAVAELKAAAPSLKNRQEVRRHIDRIRQLEEEGDRVSQEAIARLFTDEQNTVQIIKWLKIYEQMEDGLDLCKKTTKVLAGIVVKNS